MQLLVAVVIASFVGSLHCVGMCGPLVAFAVGDPRGGSGSRAWLHAAYHGGRLLTYALVGAVCGASGRGRRSRRGPARLPSGGGPAGRRNDDCRGRGRRVAGRRRPLAPASLAGPDPATGACRPAGGFRLRPLPRALCIGLLTAFLPCGWLYLFASYAAGTGSPLWGAVFMIAFWLGSVPALVLAGVGVQTLARLLGRRLPLVTVLAIVVLGVVTLVLRVQSPLHAFEPKPIRADAAVPKRSKSLESGAALLPKTCRDGRRRRPDTALAGQFHPASGHAGMLSPRIRSSNVACRWRTGWYGAAFVNEHLGGQRPRVVVRAHHKAVGPGAFDHQKLAHFGLGQRCGADEAAFGLREDVARFAQRAAHDHLALGGRRVAAAAAARSTSDDTSHTESAGPGC